MKKERDLVLWVASVLAVGLFASFLTALLLSAHYHHAYFRVLGGICEKILEQQPKAERAVAAALKDYRPLSPHRFLFRPESEAGRSIILAYGYEPSDFIPLTAGYRMGFAVIGWLVSGTAFLFLLLYQGRNERARIMLLSGYLERINRGEGGMIFPDGINGKNSVCGDEFAKLQDELDKTVTELYRTREAALAARNNFAENLSNIAHQLKTPVTAISLYLQMMGESPSPKHLHRIQLQLVRLSRLEDALLLLSRIDAGTLILERKPADVFTILTLAADNLQELTAKAGVFVHIPEQGEVLICADPDWTMEAVMNLLKNSMEHTPPGGSIDCVYEQNALYTQIRIQDTGTGFAEEDLPYLFERFYQGKNRKNGGIGIGLAISKAIIERQNGTICACNADGGGACFEIRFFP